LAFRIGLAFGIPSFGILKFGILLFGVPTFAIPTFAIQTLRQIFWLFLIRNFVSDKFRTDGSNTLWTEYWTA
jgi:hypothetical protein